MARFLLMFSMPLAAWCQLITLPSPPGSKVYVSEFPLTDHSRVDPLAPCCNESRRLMLSLFQPANCSQTHQIPYMPPATAASHDAMFGFLGIPNGTFESFRLETCPAPPKNTDFPVLLFSTGAGTSRLVYSVLCQWVASMGFNVISIDHTYDAPIVEFPDGTIVPAANLTPLEDLQKVLTVRTADVLSVLKAISNSTMTKELGIPLFRTKRVGVFGHSLGGATAADAMLLDTRLVGGLNMDGSVYGQAVNKTQKAPFMIFAAQHHNQSSDATWAAFWQQLKGTKLQLEVNGSMHGTFVDYPVLANSLGINSTSVPAVAEFIGSISGARMFNILRSYIGGFFQEVLGSTQVKLLDGPSTQFPEVSFMNRSLSTAATT
ncbi:PAF acetylhydrolase family protein [Cladophialophora carrionii]|uniref:1-alkyl-2-acetylglycerophosphocholine esterase n=1 Tax=Cladophialophora carrionii TaxID=86049 RepID=A0A1C1CS79_9EURO|nr:PAF acetylhydrolase family protein [Cladophialophora carrionii]